MQEFLVRERTHGVTAPHCGNKKNLSGAAKPTQGLQISPQHHPCGGASNKLCFLQARSSWKDPEQEDGCVEVNLAGHWDVL